MLGVIIAKVWHPLASQARVQTEPNTIAMIVDAHPRVLDGELATLVNTIDIHLVSPILSVLLNTNCKPWCSLTNTKC